MHIRTTRLLRVPGTMTALLIAFLALGWLTAGTVQTAPAQEPSLDARIAAAEKVIQEDKANVERLEASVRSMKRAAAESDGNAQKEAEKVEAIENAEKRLDRARRNLTEHRHDLDVLLKEKQGTENG